MAKSDIEGKSALVTGSSRGIGRAIALRLGEMGVNVAVNYNTSAAAADEVVCEIKRQGSGAIAVHADVGRLDDVTAMIDRIKDAWGQTDILVNNAGIIDDGLLVRMSDDAWHHVMATNLNGSFYCTRAVVRDMLRQHWGRIISVGSIVGVRGNAGQSNYAASKAAIIGFTRALSKEVANRNITVNDVAPGYVSTDTVDVLPEKLKRHILNNIPQGHFGEVDDVAHLVAYLASEKAKYITGQVIGVDGGLAV